MKNEQMQIALAKCMGWKVSNLDYFYPTWIRPSDKLGFCNPPELTLDWMHECEETLKDTEVQSYEAYLNAAISKGCRTCDFTLYASDKIWHATAIQRAEAFLKAKGVWKE